MDMQDRELLELAAKAAAITGGWGEKIEYHNGFVDLSGYWLLEGEDFSVWNPLADDGDALRLMLALHLDVEFYPDSDSVYVGYREKRRVVVSSVGAIGDIELRRAIVRTAAEIGRAMP